MATPVLIIRTLAALLLLTPPSGFLSIQDILSDFFEHCPFVNYTRVYKKIKCFFDISQKFSHLIDLAMAYEVSSDKTRVKTEKSIGLEI